MPFVMLRSFAEQWGLAWPDDAAMKEGGPRGVRYVTWAELLDRRRERQAKRLAGIPRWPEPAVVPCYVWTFYNNFFPYGGWHCYLVSRHFRIGVDPSCLCYRDLAESIMRAVPAGHLPFCETFHSWMAALAARHPRNHPSDPRPAGSVVGWLKGRRRFFLVRP